MWKYLSWSIFAICAFEVTVWFAPVLSTSSAVTVSAVERHSALAYYQLTAQLGATDEPFQHAYQRQLLSVSVEREVAQNKIAQRADWHAQQADSSSSAGARAGGVASMMGGLVLASGALLLAYGRGPGLVARAAGEGGGGGGGADQGKKKANRSLAASSSQSSSSSSSETTSTTALSSVTATTMGTTLAVAGAVLLSRRGLGAKGALQRASIAFRQYSSGSKRAPFAEPLVRAAVEKQPTAAVAGSSSSPAASAVGAVPSGVPPTGSFEVVPPHAFKPQKVDCGQGLEVPPAKMSPEQLMAFDDATLVEFVRDGKLAAHSLEKSLGDLTRAVRVRRAVVAGSTEALSALPFENYDYANVIGACAENVLGYVPVPVGVAGPVLMDGMMMHIPMATTEGCLIASTHRGCKAITESGGATTVLVNDGMTRAPAVQLPNAKRAGELVEWIQVPANEQILRDAFHSTTRFGKLLEITPTMAGRTVYLRFRAKTGDAMGMNMISKGVEAAMEALGTVFPDADCIALSGNMCTDKKPSAINWINGRGKSVVAEAVIRKDIVEKVLKTTVDDLVNLNTSKNLVGSAMAGSIGGFNAHASNIVTAMYIATGQDPAQNVESSNCITLMERAGEDLRVSVTMPSIECAAIGGGTHLPAQSASMKLMNCHGSDRANPGANAQKFARAVAVATLAGELSLMSALCAGHLVRAHMVHNRKKN